MVKLVDKYFVGRTIGMDPRQGRGIDMLNYEHAFVILHLQIMVVVPLRSGVGLTHEVGFASMGVGERNTNGQ